jgi:ubiquinone/menaquinone biosynthesis C-methylase UbiE
MNMLRGIGVEMNFYARVILPWLLDWAMDRETLNRHRRELLAEAQGDVLEIGFGTGVNLPFYPGEVRRLTTIDPNPGVNRLAQKRIQSSPISVDHRITTAEVLPVADNSFDTVVSTMTLCSIPNVEQALSEVYRVLKPRGRFLFLEHGRSPEPKVKRWQERLTPITKVLGDGCHLNRDIGRIISERPFGSVAVRNFYLEDAPKFTGYMYQGMAQKP